MTYEEFIGVETALQRFEDLHLRLEAQPSGSNRRHNTETILPLHDAACHLLPSRNRYSASWEPRRHLIIKAIRHNLSSRLHKTCNDPFNQWKVFFPTYYTTTSV